MSKHSDKASKKRRQRGDVFIRLTFPGGDVVALPPVDLLLLGRSDDCDIVVPESNVSRRHAEIRRIERGFSLRDLGSTNGTYRNTDRAGELELRDGDIVQLGDVAFLWEVLVAGSKGIRPIRDKILVDGTARLEEQVESVAFLWVARLGGLKKHLELPPDSTHLVLGLPREQGRGYNGFAYHVTGDGTVASRKQVQAELPAGSLLKNMLAKAVMDTTYSLEDVEAVSKGEREGDLPSEVRLLGFA